MTDRQKEIQSYIIAAILILAAWGDTMNHYVHNGYEYSIKMEQKTGQHWVQDLKGNPLGDY